LFTGRFGYVHGQKEFFIRLLGLRQDPIVRAESDAIYIELRVFSRNDPTDVADFEVCLAKKSAQQFAVDLTDAIEKIT
jgi:hypothetical protein